mgnify:CR=1 FL=1|jgi:hypothetical protein
MSKGMETNTAAIYLRKYSVDSEPKTTEGPPPKDRS